MELSVQQWMIGGGIVLLVLALLVRRWVARYDLKEAAFDSAWHVARGRRSAENPTALEEKLRDINAAGTLTGKASRAAGTVAGHLMAHVLGIGAMFAGLAGAALVAAGLLWK